MTFGLVFLTPTAAKATLAFPEGFVLHVRLFVGSAFAILAAGCGMLPDWQPMPNLDSQELKDSKVQPVDVAIARTGIVREELEYTGTTARCRKYHPSQAEGAGAESVS